MSSSRVLEALELKLVRDCLVLLFLSCYPLFSLYSPPIFVQLHFVHVIRAFKCLFSAAEIQNLPIFLMSKVADEILHFWLCSKECGSRWCEEAYAS